MAETNYYDKETGLYHYQGKTYSNPADYSSAVQAYRASIGLETSQPAVSNSQPAVSNSQPAVASSVSAQGTGGGDTGIGTKYLKTENGLIYGAQKIQDMPEADQTAFREMMTQDKYKDKYQILDDGSLVFKDKDGSNQYIPVGDSNATVDKSAFNEADIKKLADLKYLAQNTGVSTKDMNAAYTALGLDPNDSTVASKADSILRGYGYKPGENRTFYGNNQAGDVGAQLLYQQWQKAPEENVVNVSQMNKLWLKNALEKNGLDTSASSARLDGLDFVSEDSARQGIQKVYDTWVKGGRSVDDELDIFEWGQQTGGGDTDPGGPASGITANIIGGNQPIGVPCTTISPGCVPVGEWGHPCYGYTPGVNTNAVKPVYSCELTGTTDTDITTYNKCLDLQGTDFAERANCQSGFYQPQTLTEQQKAGSAPAFENKLYRNKFGMTMYIQHISGQPTQPIPPGYAPVQDVATMNTGGVVSGYATGGLEITPWSGGEASGYSFNGTKYLTCSEAKNACMQYLQALNATTDTTNTSTNTGTDNTGTTNIGSDADTTNTNTDAASNLNSADSPYQYNTYQADDGSLVCFDKNTNTMLDANGNPYSGSFSIGTQTYSSVAGAVENAPASAQPTGVTAAGINQAMPTDVTTVTPEQLQQYQANMMAQVYAAPGGSAAAAPVSYMDPNTDGTVVESTAGQAMGTAPIVGSDQLAQVGSVTTADIPQKIGASTMTPSLSFSDIQNATTGMEGAQGTLGTQSQVNAAQATGSSVSGLDAASSNYVAVTNPAARVEQTGEIISGVANAQTAADFTEQVQAATATPSAKATVQGQLETLMTQFEGGNTPAWAAGAMRAAMENLSARGLGASSLAGQAVIQAAMESALPIAIQDAQVQAQFEGQNLSNRQQMAVLAAQQRAAFMQMEFDQGFQARVQNAARIADIANMNFTAEQQIALENSRAANTMALQNLSNSQAMVMAEAASLAQLDTQNLNNRQQAAVQNAQNFLQMDLSNLNNSQQSTMLKQQSIIQSLFTDQAAVNASLQFNAQSENQTNQFFANLSSGISQFNAAQMNAMNQFNADEVNALAEFNAAIQNQREMFNAQNYLVVAQANAQWRQNLTTLNTAAANQANMDYAQTVNALTAKALDELWQRERDIMDYTFTSSENASDRALNLLLADKKLDAVRMELDSEEDTARGSLWTKVLFGNDFGGGLFSSLFD